MGAHQTHGTRSALHTPICDRLGIQYPIFGFSHSLEVKADRPPWNGSPQDAPR